MSGTEERERTKKTRVEGVLSKGNGAMAPPYRFRGNARVRWMNVIEGCPVEFARALVLYPVACNRRAISIRTKSVLSFLCYSCRCKIVEWYLRTRQRRKLSLGNCQLPNDSKYISIESKYSIYNRFYVLIIRYVI